jgi:TRAP-type C4-dicarboxylate transport system substrate-binding protein
MIAEDQVGAVKAVGRRDHDLPVAVAVQGARAVHAAVARPARHDVLPLSYAGGERPAYNLTLMPGLVKNHDHAARMNDSPFMEAIEEIMAEDDVMVLVHGYLAGGFAGVDKCITAPEDIAGLQTRAAGKAFEQMLAEAGASIASMASSEIYNAMQTGVLDAANTSSSSFVSAIASMSR